MVTVKIKAHDFESRLFRGQVRFCLKAPLVTNRKGMILPHVSFWLVNNRKFCFYVCQNRPQFEPFFRNITSDGIQGVRTGSCEPVLGVS